ncbi:MAG TPA: hypothetical protein PLJ78_02335 [Anaerolineae bacterium]|nr:hypothetical protein [Anaerolineae bacterium]HQK12763.1 hypothetical protein [Anaerolineae bacterium]
MLKGHQDMLWLAGQVFLSRNFVKEAEEQGLDAIFAACPYGDLTEQEKAAFASAFEDKELRKVVKKWWKAYDEEREAGSVAKIGDFWE